MLLFSDARSYSSSTLAARGHLPKLCTCEFCILAATVQLLQRPFWLRFSKGLSLYRACVQARLAQQLSGSRE